MIYLLIAIVDMALILGAYFLASFVYLGDPLEPEQLVNMRVLSWRDSGILFLVIYAFLLVVGYAATRVFGSIYFGQIRKMAKSVLLVNFIGLVLFMSSFYVFNLDDASRILVLLFFVFSTFFVCLANWIAIHLFRLHRNSQNYRRNVLVVGGGRLAEEYAKAVAERPSRPEHVIGYIDPNLSPYQQFNVSASQREFLGCCLGSIWNIEFAFQSFQIDEIVLALDIEDYACVGQAVATADKHGVSLTLVPFYNDIIPRKPNIESFGGVNVVDLRSMPLSNPVYELIKRASDIIVSLFVIIITSWLMAITAIGVKLSSPGPVLFKQTRLGKGNKTFEMLKFRSMKVNDASDVAWSTDEDPRKTRFGSLIRKYSIDELPQFFNVLKGDMSIVGPRPEIPFYVQRFSTTIPLYMLRHQVRPGITGLAQISGLRGDTSISERIELDIYYIQHWSFWMDVKIFFKTLFGGFVNDEVLSESEVSKKLSGTKFGDCCTMVHESATEGVLGKVFDSVYLIAAFAYIFLFFYVNSVQEIIPGLTPSLAMDIYSAIAFYLPVLGIVIWFCEARKPSFWIIAILCFLLFNHIYARSGVISFVAIYGFVFAYPQKLKIEDVAKTAFAGTLLSVVVTVGASLTGKIPDIVEYRGSLERHSYGFITPVALSNIVTTCLIPYIYFRLRNWRWSDVLVCLLVGITVFIVANGRIAFAMLVFFVLFACVCRFEKVQALMQKIAPWVTISCFCLTAFIVFVYWQGVETPISHLANSFTSGRLGYISSYLDEYSVKWFGQPLATVSRWDTHMNPAVLWRGIDCSYMNILLRFGIVGCALLLLPSIWLGYQAKREKYTAAIFVMVIIAIYAMVENVYYNPIYNFAIFIMGYFIAAWSTTKELSPEQATAPIVKEIDWVNIKGSRWKDFLTEE